MMGDGLVEMVGRERAVEMAMSTRGDFELVFTGRPEELEAARKVCALTMMGEETGGDE
jgi:thiamine monophosphate kinase